MIFHYISDVLYSKIGVFLEATQNFSPNLKNINLVRAKLKTIKLVFAASLLNIWL